MYNPFGVGHPTSMTTADPAAAILQRAATIGETRLGTSGLNVSRIAWG